MMRPSHPISTSLPSHMFSRRLAAVGLVVAAQILIVWTLVSGLAVRLADNFHSFQYVAVDDKVKPSIPPPPLPHLKDVAPPTVAPPLFNFEVDPGTSGITARAPQEQAIAPKPTQPPPVKVVPDRAASAIIATETTPPYPAVAQRLGVEGKVILRLSVLADGTVGKAEVVTSSGRHDLDETAQQWIIAHWIYKPAIKDGAPAASEVLAAVQFTLH